MNFTGCINAFRVIERLQRMKILGGQNIESVKEIPGVGKIYLWCCIQQVPKVVEVEFWIELQTKYHLHLEGFLPVLTYKLPAFLSSFYFEPRTLSAVDGIAIISLINPDILWVLELLNNKMHYFNSNFRFVLDLWFYIWSRSIYDR